MAVIMKKPANMKTPMIAIPNAQTQTQATPSRSWPGSTRGPSAHGLDPWASIAHGRRLCQLPWIPGPRPGMDEVGLLRVRYLIEAEQ
jgi:hypothetical protein